MLLKYCKIAFPAVSTGVYGFPHRRAADIAVKEACEFLDSHPSMEATFVCFNEETYRCYLNALNRAG